MDESATTSTIYSTPWTVQDLPSSLYVSIHTLQDGSDIAVGLVLVCKKIAQRLFCPVFVGIFQLAPIVRNRSSPLNSPQQNSSSKSPNKASKRRHSCIMQTSTDTAASTSALTNRVNSCKGP